MVGTFLGIYTGLKYESSSFIRLRIREALNNLKRYGKEIAKGETVALKVNIPIPLGPEYAASTHPEILKAVIEELKLIGAKPTVYEDCYSSVSPHISGIVRAAEETGVEFINLNGKKYTEVEVNGQVYQYYEDILRADHLISLPKLKTHVFTNYSGAIKNMYGCIIKEQRKSLHKHTFVEDFSEKLVDIFSIKLPTLVIMDGILGMEGSGPTHGTPKQAGLLLISNDGVILDYYASAIMSYDPMSIETNRIAIERKINKSCVTAVDMPGVKHTEIDLNFKLVPVLKGAMKKRFIEMSRGAISISSDLCVRCGDCVASCPFGAIKMEDYPVINSRECKLCYCCLELCPHNAVTSIKKLKA